MSIFGAQRCEPSLIEEILPDIGQGQIETCYYIENGILVEQKEPFEDTELSQSLLYPNTKKARMNIEKVAHFNGEETCLVGQSIAKDVNALDPKISHKLDQRTVENSSIPNQSEANKPRQCLNNNELIDDEVDSYSDQVTSEQKEGIKLATMKALKHTHVMHLNLLSGRSDLLSGEEWTEFAQVVMMSVMNLADRKQFAVKHHHIIYLRCFLRDSFEWARMVPQVLTEKRKKSTNKDVGYQALLKKKNNYQSHRTYMAKIKEDLITSHRRTVKETTKVSEDNLFPVQYGTLVGATKFGSLSMTERNEYRQLLKDIRSTPHPKKELINKVLRLWECTFAQIYETTDSDRKNMFLEGKFPQLQQFKYLEAYTGKILQMQGDGMNIFLENLGDFFNIWPDVQKHLTVKRPPLLELLDRSPSLYALHMVAAAVGDSPHFMSCVGEQFQSAQDIESECQKSKLPTTIIQMENQTFGVMSQGILFIKELTSDQAAFVYCAAPDLFSYSVSKKTSIKLAKSETSMEFARRNFLMVPDTTSTKPSFDLINNIYQVKLKRELLRQRRDSHKISTLEAIESYKLKMAKNNTDSEN